VKGGWGVGRCLHRTWGVAGGGVCGGCQERTLALRILVVVGAFLFFSRWGCFTSCALFLFPVSYPFSFFVAFCMGLSCLLSCGGVILSRRLLLFLLLSSALLIVFVFSHFFLVSFLLTLLATSVWAGSTGGRCGGSWCARAAVRGGLSRSRRCPRERWLVRGALCGSFRG